MMKQYDAIAEPVAVVLDNLWHIRLPLAAVVIVVVVVILILRKWKNAKKKDE